MNILNYFISLIEKKFKLLAQNTVKFNVKVFQLSTISSSLKKL